MATQLSSITSASELLEACDTLGSSLAADPATADLAPAWEELATRAAELVRAKHEMSRNAARLKGRAAVLDARWDAEIDAFAAAALEASGNKLDQPPFSRFFARKGPAEAKSAGTELSLTILNRWLEELGRDEKDAFAATWLPRLRESVEPLSAAVQGRKAGDEARKAHEAQLAEARQKVGGTYDELEAALGQRFPEQAARVASFSADVGSSAARPSGPRTKKRRARRPTRPRAPRARPPPRPPRPRPRPEGRPGQRGGQPLLRKSAPARPRPANLPCRGRPDGARDL